VAAIALSGALALSLSGCTMWMHVETARPYHPSDGVNVTVGDLQLRNVLVLTEDGELGNLIGTAVNLTGSDIEFTVQWKADGQYQEVELTADANGRTSFGIDEQVTFEPLGEPAGGLLEAVVHLSDDQKGVRIPVLDATLVEYEDALATPTPTPSPIETEATEPESTEG
jgi:hypothetical protein